MQSFTAPVTGTYLLEALGAQGGNNNGASDRATPDMVDMALVTSHQIKDKVVGENGNRAIRQYRYTYNGGGRAYDALVEGLLIGRYSKCTLWNMAIPVDYLLLLRRWVVLGAGQPKWWCFRSRLSRR